jgi:chaperonin GroES
MQIHPLSDRVLLRGVEAETTTKSGIILSVNAAKERPNIYEVIAFGPGRMSKDGVLEKIELSVGDRVLAGQYSGDEVEVDGAKYRIVAYEYILARLG